MNAKPLLIILFLFFAFNMIALLPGYSENEPPPDFVLPESNISFNEHILEMFITKCGTESGCHSPGNTDAHFPYVELINRNGVINHTLFKTGEKLVSLNIHQSAPQEAPLYLILLEGYAPAEVLLMPLNRTPLNQNQLNGIKQWIMEEAPE